MNKTEVIAEVSRMTNISVSDCEKVLDAFEEVLGGELNRKGWKNGISEMIFKIMGKIKGKKGVIGIYIFLFILSMNAWGQKEGRILTQNIRGRVIDAASGYPVAYASVYLMGKTEVGGVTDSLGCFVIKNVPIGRHDIQVSFVGYEPTIFREILVTSSKEVNLTIPLKESIKELDEVMIRPQLNKEQPLNKMVTTGARMLSVEEASRYAGGMDDPARLVSSFAGISPSMSTNGISIHGNAPHLLQWKLEDVEIPNPNHFADLSILGGGILSGLNKAVHKAIAYHSLLLKEEKENIEASNTEYFFVKSERRYFKINYKDILFIEGLKDYVIIQLDEQRVITRMNLKNIFELLPKHNFLRVNKSYIVNTKHIDSFDNNDIFIKTHEIAIGNTYRDAFFETFMRMG